MGNGITNNPHPKWESKISMIEFFKNSEFLDYEVLRPLSHIRGNWELSLSSDHELYEVEGDSFAKELNDLIIELNNTKVPDYYHDNEDKLAEYVKDKFNSEIKKVGNAWVGQDYRIILQDGGFFDLNESNLVQSATGRIISAKKLNQNRFDDMEQNHRKMLSVILSLILYHRCTNA